MASVKVVTFAVSALLGLLQASAVHCKEPYLDFTCVASQALVPTETGIANVSITAYSPLGNASYTLDGVAGASLNADRVGGYRCLLETDDYESVTTVIISAEDASLYPPRLTVTYDPLTEDDLVELEMIIRDDCDGHLDYRWREEGSSRKFLNYRLLALMSADTNCSSIVFRNFFKFCSLKKGYVQVLFRECPTGKWSPEDDCQLDCSICLNGGMCHPGRGQCICPPGFSGSECQNVHGRNIFGQLGQYSCNVSADRHDDGCRGQLFCLPEPFGCTCAAGYKGIDCSKECEEGTYGANCEQLCHCHDNSTCLLDTGECGMSPCLDGWTGPNCQEPLPRVSLAYDEVNRNQTTNLTCTVTSGRPPFNESGFVLVPPDGGGAVFADYFVEYEHPVMAEYVFYIVADYATATYTCTDVNMIVNASIMVTAHEPPRLSSPPTVLNSTSDTVTLTWELWRQQTGDQGAGPVVKYVITYNRVPGTDGTVTAGVVSGDTTVFVVQGLMEDTAYEFRVAAARLGVGGEGPPSPPAMGNTTCAVPGLPTDLSVEPINATSLWLTWSPPSNTSCASIAYHVSYWLRRQGQCRQRPKGNLDEITTFDNSLVLTGLLADSFYKVMITSETEAGLSEKPVRNSGRTDESVPGPPPVLFNGATSTTLLFSWTAPDCQNQNGVILGYHYQLLDNQMDIVAEGTRAPSEEAVRFNSLVPCSELHFRVRAWTVAGNGSFSVLLTATTENEVPDEVNDLQITGINSTQLRVNWFPPESVPCPITHYTISYTLVQQGQCERSMAADTLTVTTADTTTTLRGLLPYSEYEVVVKAVTAAGEGIMSIGSNRTWEGVSGPPESVQAFNQTSDSLSFSWDPPVCPDRNGLITEYRVYFRNVETGSVLTEVVNETRVTFANLPACATFSFQAAAGTIAGFGELSEKVFATTGSVAPNAVTNVQVQPSENALLLTWSLPDNATCDITSYLVSYRLVRYLQCPDDQVDSPQVNVTRNAVRGSYTIPGLMHGAKYVVSVRAETEGGLGDERSVEINTRESTPGTPRANVTQVTSRSLTFEWEPPSCEETNGVILSYNYKLVNTKTGTFVDERNSLSNVRTAAFENLSPCTEYHFKVRARTSAGNGSFSEAEHAFTEAEVPGAVGSLEITHSKRTLFVYWRPPLNTTCNIHEYNLTYVLVDRLACGADQSTSEPVNVTTTRTSYTITGLSPYSRYRVSVAALTSAGAGEPVFNFEDTLPDVPSMPTVVNNTLAMPSSLAFSWFLACEDLNSPIVGFHLQLTDTTTGTELNGTTMANVTTVTFDGLPSCTEYEFRVRAQTSAGYGRPSLPFQISTLGQAPNPVTSFQVSPYGNSLRLTWSPPDNATCDIITYLVSYRLVRYLQCPDDQLDSPQVNVTRNAVPRSYSILGLMPGAKYAVSVRAETLGGLGEEKSAEARTAESNPGTPRANVTQVTSRSLTFEWEPPACEEANGVILSYNYKLVNTETRAYVDVRDSSSNVTTAIFETLTPCTQYHFKVRAMTSAGRGSFSEAEYAFTEAEVPGAVRSLRIRPTKRTLEVTWSPPPNAPCDIISYTLTYALIKRLACEADDGNTEVVYKVTFTGSAYEIRDLSPYSRYRVSVVALTSAGAGEPVTKDADTLQDVPLMPASVNNTLATPTSLAFSWDSPGCEDLNGPIIGFHYQLTERRTNRMQNATTAGNVTSVAFDGLSPCTEYEFRVQAQTSSGYGLFSSAVRSSTLVAVPGKVDGIRAKQTNSTYSLLSWPSPRTTDNPCSIQSYAVTYRFERALSCQLDLNESYTLTTTTRRVSLDSLRPNSDYVVQVTASTSAGNGETSDDFIFQTDAKAPDRITNVRVTNATMDSLHFAWSELECVAQHDEIAGYRYEFGKNPEDDDDDDSITSRETTQLFETFSSLDACTEYVFRVQAVGSEFDGVWSEWLTAETTTALPGKVKNLTLLPGNDDSSQIRLSWQQSMSDDCPVRSYRVAYAGQNLAECSQNSTDRSLGYVTVEGTGVVLRDLQPFSLYTVTVRGETSIGLGKEESRTIRTSEDVPSGPPQNITASTIGPNDIHFVWQPPTCNKQNGIIEGYEYSLYINESTLTPKTGQTEATDVLIAGLVPFSDYLFTVRASTAVGPGPTGRLAVRTAEGVPTSPRNARVVAVATFTLELEWLPPYPPTGTVTAYRIKYWPLGLEESSAVLREYIGILTNGVHRYIIADLTPFSFYNIQIQGKTGAGYGNWSRTLTNRTAQGAPEAPYSASVSERTENTITVHWVKPTVLNGILSGYEIQCEVIHRPFEASANDVTGSRGQGNKEVKISQQATSYRLERLEPATGYRVTIAARTVRLGEPFVLSPVYTKIPVFESPIITEEPVLNENNEVTLQLKEFVSPYISLYQVTVARKPSVRKRETSGQSPMGYKNSPDNYVAAEFNKTELPSSFRVGDGKTYGGYYNAPLEEGTDYSFQFCGVGKTTEDTQTSCSNVGSVKTRATGGSALPAIIGAVLGILLLVVLVLFVMVAVRKRKRRMSSDPCEVNGAELTNMEKAESRTNGLQNQALVEEMVRSQLRRSGGVKSQTTTTPVKTKPVKVAVPPKKAWKPHKPIGLHDLPDYVKKKKARGNKAFTRDYGNFLDEQLYPWEVAQKDINKNKNRYANIIPYDYSRVVLDPLDDNPETDYINASYIDGYKQKNAYIATQGPNKFSTPDFWRMVWQQEVGIIVMLTNMVENGKKKCARYWPEDQLMYDGIVVKLSSERVHQDFTERVFVISNINIGEDMPREVKQFHFTSWPDMGLPDSPAPLMNFIHEVKQIEEDNAGPMVVHCSAGVGRTGTFITVDSMLNMVAEEKQINVIDFVYEMRRKRTKMVQTQEQYMFIFEVLLETLLCGDTVMNINTFPDQYAELHHHNPLTGNTYVEEHFRVLDTMSVAPSDDNCHGGRNEMNLDKNRYHDCIPLDRSRPYLMSPGDEHSTNYINASFIDGFKKKDGFLATQTPLPNTVGDFWRMVYDYNVRIIVMLNQIDRSDQTCASYWLDDPEEIALYGIFEVQLRDYKSFKHTVARTFKLKNTNKATEKPRIIHHFEFKMWHEEDELPSVIRPFLNFMELVDQDQAQTGGDSRTAVHCLDGVSRCGVFCASMASLAKLKAEKVVDVFHAVRNLRRNRDLMVETQEQYLFCYEVLKAYLEENQTYANFR